MDALGRDGLRVDNDHDVQSGPQWECARINNSPDLALQSITHDGALQPSSGPQPNARDLVDVASGANREPRASCPASPSVHGVEDPGALQAGMSCRRPFRRRRWSVLRPPRERMRRRKPCVRARFRRDTFRRCFFIPGFSVGIIRLPCGGIKGYQFRFVKFMEKPCRCGGEAATMPDPSR